MCGIAGILAEDAAQYRPALERMHEALRHRGPDGEGVWQSPGGQVLLAHRRLSILDLSECGRQPMVSADGRHVIAYNGECYNFRDLQSRDALRGLAWRSTSDTEVVLELLARQGSDALPELAGMFAGALWDERERSLLLFRDRLGIKPVYYATPQPGLFVFASEVRALLASGLVERRLDRAALESFLAYGFVQSPLTIIEGVRELPPAHWMSLRPGGTPAPRRYWTIPFPAAGESEPAGPELDQRIRDLFVSSVERHLVSDVPVGVFLSGGVDSGAILSAVARVSGGITKTVTAAFPDEDVFDEGQEARRLAQRAGAEHVEVPLSARDLLALLHESLEVQDQPSTDAVNTYIVSRAARQAGLTVVLSGLGGDELFGGYPSFRDVPRALRLHRSLRFLRPGAWEALARACRGDRRFVKIAELMRTDGSSLGCYLARRRLFSSSQIHRLLSERPDGWIAGLEPAAHRDLAALSARLDPIDAVSLGELSVYMGSQLLRDCDVMGMAHSLEIRVPFLDNDLVDAVAAAGPAARRYDEGRKPAFVRAMDGIIDPALGRKRKMGFTMPFERWILGDLREQVEEVLTSNVLDGLGGFRPAAAAGLWSGFLRNPRRFGWTRPWSLYVLGRYVERHGLS